VITRRPADTYSVAAATSTAIPRSTSSSSPRTAAHAQRANELGNGTFAPTDRLSWRAQIPFPSRTGDFNGDAQPDVVVPNGFNAVSVLLNDGNGTLRQGDYPASLVS